MRRPFCMSRTPSPIRRCAACWKQRVFALSGRRVTTRVYTRPGVLRPVVIPKYSSVPVFIIKNNLRTAGISRERYFELLKG